MRQPSRSPQVDSGILDEALDRPPYNFIIHSAPFRDPSDESYHWHIEIMPILSKVAGFEWGTGIFINPTPPEEPPKPFVKS